MENKSQEQQKAKARADIPAKGIRDWLQILPLIMNLLKEIDPDVLIRLFYVPPITNESAFRKWVQDLFTVLEVVGNIIPGEIDNMLIESMSKVVSDDNLWGVFYRLVLKFFADGNFVMDDAAKLETSKEMDVDDRVIDVAKQIADVVR